MILVCGKSNALPYGSSVSALLIHHPCAVAAARGRRNGLRRSDRPQNCDVGRFLICLRRARDTHTLYNQFHRNKSSQQSFPGRTRETDDFAIHNFTHISKAAPSTAFYLCRPRHAVRRLCSARSRCSPFTAMPCCGSWHDGRAAAHRSRRACHMWSGPHCVHCPSATLGNCCFRRATAHCVPRHGSP